jgi:hypothetical protein|tara:strand:- start:1611 stop:2441 length:831 start_codon:yes stop_codon:yes gene_type:complete
MSATSLFNATQYVSQICGLAQSLGMTLQVSTDFEALRETLAQRPELTLYPMFDTAASYVTPANAFWIKGTNELGQLVHLQAMRVLPTQNQSLAEHLMQHRRLYVLRGDMVDPDPLLYQRAPAATAITGKLCYHGQLWIKGGDGGYRAQGLSTILPRLALVLALLEWAPDYVFGFVNPVLASRGAAAQYGYYHLEPGIWHNIDRSRSAEQWLAWLSRRDLEYLLHFDPQDLFMKLREKNKLGGELDPQRRSRPLGLDESTNKELAAAEQSRQGLVTA